MTRVEEHSKMSGAWHTGRVWSCESINRVMTGWLLHAHLEKNLFDMAQGLAVC